MYSNYSGTLSFYYTTHGIYAFIMILDEDDDFNTNRLATAPRLGTTMRTAAVPNPRIGTSNARPRTTTGRALTGMVIRRHVNIHKVYFC